MPVDPETESPEEADGGPVKSFLEHLEDFRWVLIKSIVALALGMLICLFGANDVVALLKWPLSHNPVLHLAQNVKLPWLHIPLRRVDTNQVAIVSFGTNQLGNFVITPDEQKAFNLSTNHFVTVQIEPVIVGTNQVLSWQASEDT